MIFNNLFSDKYNKYIGVKALTLRGTIQVLIKQNRADTHKNTTTNNPFFFIIK